MKRANDLGASTWSYLIPMMVAGTYYYIICKSVMFFGTILEHRINKHVKRN
jgi:ABC-type amino acid transport system permease subunit